MYFADVMFNKHTLKVNETVRNKRVVKSISLETKVADLLEKKAGEENRSASNFMETLLKKELLKKGDKQ